MNTTPNPPSPICFDSRNLVERAAPVPVEPVPVPVEPLPLVDAPVAAMVADWSDARTAHPDPDAEWDRSNGRVYRVQMQSDAKFRAHPENLRDVSVRRAHSDCASVDRGGGDSTREVGGDAIREHTAVRIAGHVHALLIDAVPRRERVDQCVDEADVVHGPASPDDG